ncbi:MAG: hypothetical protein QG608_611 [Actinomycetota bacterium]|nr:hypothetical protein [Actinomycetota bacterium]
MHGAEKTTVALSTAMAQITMSPEVLVHRTAHPVAPSAAAPQRRSRALRLVGAVLLGAVAAFVFLATGSAGHGGSDLIAEKWPCSARF